MLQIGICDDEPADLEQIGQCIQRFFQKAKRDDFRIWQFYSSGDMLEFLGDHSCDLYFLDVLMPEINGLELGRAIRKKCAYVPIVYITSSREYAFEAFDVRAYHYLEKPIHQETVSGLLNELLTLYPEVKERQISIRTREGVIAAEISRIVYVENIFRTAVYHLNDGKEIASVSLRGSFEEAIQPLNEQKDFIQPHKSFFVNMNYIQTLQNDSLVLDDGTAIAVSRKRMADTKRQFLKFLAGGEKKN